MPRSQEVVSTEHGNGFIFRTNRKLLSRLQIASFGVPFHHAAIINYDLLEFVVSR